MAHQDPNAGWQQYEPRAREADGGLVREQEPASKVRDVVDQAQQKAGQAVGQAQERAKTELDQQKGRAAEGLGSVAQALRTTGQQMRNQEYDAVAQYAEKIADQVDYFSRRLRDKDVDEIVSDVEDFARQQPALFVGGALALGFLVSRFVKSSGQRRYDMADYPQVYSQGMGGQYRGMQDYSRPERESTQVAEGTGRVL
jgi:hypothetical protein